MSSFNQKKRNTNATRKRTRQRLAGTEEDGGRRGAEHQLEAGKVLSVEERLSAAGLKRTGAGFKKPEPWAARLAARADNVEGPQDVDLQNAKLEIMVPDSANDKKWALVNFLKKLRESEAKARQKTRVVVFCELARTARMLEGALGNMVAKKTPTMGYRGLGLGSATRTSYENIGATTLQAGMQESYVQSILREFSGGKTLTVLATDVGALPLLMHTDKIGHVINYDSPESLAQHRERVAYAGKPGATFTHIWSRTRKEKEMMEPVVTWMEEQGCVLPAEVRSDLGLAGPAAPPAAVSRDSAPPPQHTATAVVGSASESSEEDAEEDEAERRRAKKRRRADAMRLATLSQLDEAALDGASAGASASCSAIPARSIVTLPDEADESGLSSSGKKKKKKKTIKNSQGTQQETTKQEAAVGSKKKKKGDKKKSDKKRKRGAALLVVTEH
jgi:hypothetical protein